MNFILDNILRAQTKNLTCLVPTIEQPTLKQRLTTDFELLFYKTFQP